MVNMFSSLLEPSIESSSKIKRLTAAMEVFRFKRGYSRVAVVIVLLHCMGKAEPWLFSQENSYSGVKNGSTAVSAEKKPNPINPNGNYGDKLILTDYMLRSRSGELIWKELARVSNITDVLSYSGFFTVNQEFNSNLFFWFFPAAVCIISNHKIQKVTFYFKGYFNESNSIIFSSIMLTHPLCYCG